MWFVVGPLIMLMIFSIPLKLYPSRDVLHPQHFTLKSQQHLTSKLLHTKHNLSFITIFVWCWLLVLDTKQHQLHVLHTLCQPIASSDLLLAILLWTGIASLFSRGGSNERCMQHAYGQSNYFWFLAEWIPYLFIFLNFILKPW